MKESIQVLELLKKKFLKRNIKQRNMTIVMMNVVVVAVVADLLAKMSSVVIIGPVVVITKVGIGGDVVFSLAFEVPLPSDLQLHRAASIRTGMISFFMYRPSLHKILC